MAKYVQKNEVSRGSFDEFMAAARRLNEINDCSVKAVATVCGVSYEEAHAAMEVVGRKRRRGVSHDQIFRAVKSLGKKVDVRGYDAFTAPEKLVEKLANERNYKVKNLTTRQMSMFPDLIDANDTYLVFTSGHVVAVKGGIVHCWGATKALRVLSMYEITD